MSSGKQAHPDGQQGDDTIVASASASATSSFTTRRSNSGSKDTTGAHEGGSQSSTSNSSTLSSAKSIHAASNNVNVNAASSIQETSKPSNSNKIKQQQYQQSPTSTKNKKNKNEVIKVTARIGDAANHVWKKLFTNYNTNSNSSSSGKKDNQAARERELRNLKKLSVVKKNASQRKGLDKLIPSFQDDKWRKDWRGIHLPPTALMIHRHPPEKIPNTMIMGGEGKEGKEMLHVGVTLGVGGQENEHILVEGVVYQPVVPQPKVSVVSAPKPPKSTVPASTGKRSGVPNLEGMPEVDRLLHSANDNLGAGGTRELPFGKFVFFYQVHIGWFCKKWGRGVILLCVNQCEKPMLMRSSILAHIPLYVSTSNYPPTTAGAGGGPSIPLYPLLLFLALFFILKHIFLKHIFTYQKRMRLQRAIQDRLRDGIFFGGNKKQFRLSQDELNVQLKRLKERSEERRRSSGNLSKLGSGGDCKIMKDEEKDGDQGGDGGGGSGGNIGGGGNGNGNQGGSRSSAGRSSTSNNQSSSSGKGNSQPSSSSTGGTTRTNSLHKNFDDQPSFIKYMKDSEQLERAHQKIEQLTADAVCANERAEMLHEELLQLKQDKTTSDAALSKAERRISKLEEENEILNIHDETTLKARYDEMADSLTRMKDRYHSAAEQVVQLQGENQLLKDKVQQLEEENEELDEEMEHLVDEMEHLDETQLQQHEEQKEHQGESVEFDEDGSNSGSLMGETLTLDNNDDDDDDDSNDDDENVNKLRKELDNAKADISSLANVIGLLLGSAQRDEAQKDATRFSREVSLAKLRSDDSSTKATTPTSCCDGPTEISFLTEIPSNHTIETYEAIRAERDELKLELEVAKACILRLEQEVDEDANDKSRGLATNAVELQEENERLVGVNEELRLQAEKATTYCSKIEVEKNECLKKLERVVEEKETVDAELTEVKSKLKDTTAGLRERIEQMSQEFNVLVEENVKLAQERDELQAGTDTNRLATMKNENDMQISQLEARVAALAQERDELIAKVENITGELSLAKKESHNSQSDEDELMVSFNHKLRRALSSSFEGEDSSAKVVPSETPNVECALPEPGEASSDTLVLGPNEHVESSSSGGIDILRLVTAAKMGDKAAVDQRCEILSQISAADSSNVDNLIKRYESSKNSLHGLKIESSSPSKKASKSPTKSPLLRLLSRKQSKRTSSAKR